MSEDKRPLPGIERRLYMAVDAQNPALRVDISVAGIVRLAFCFFKNDGVAKGTKN